MKKRFGNILKGWITSIIGVILLIVSVVLIVDGRLPVVWEGIGLICMAVILLYAPQTIEKFIMHWVKGGNANVTPRTPDNDGVG